MAGGLHVFRGGLCVAGLGRTFCNRGWLHNHNNTNPALEREPHEIKNHRSTACALYVDARMGANGVTDRPFQYTGRWAELGAELYGHSNDPN